jgi:flagellar biosynthesis/type III secretory pathway chaperone
MNDDTSKLVSNLIERLREELQEYGEMLALLDQQQESVLARAGEEVTRTALATGEQMARVQAARQRRLEGQQAVAAALGHAAEPDFATLIPQLPSPYRVAVDTLVRQNNGLLVRVQQRARQNHLLLGRAMQLMQQFINVLVPAAGPAVYNGVGELNTPARSAAGLYEAVG